MPNNSVSRELEQALKNLRSINDSLRSTLNGWADPPDPDNVLATLNEIKNHSAITTTLADQMIAKIR